MALDPRTEAKLRPAKPPFAHGHKTITGPGDEKNDIYYEEYGNPKGEPVFVLHGGPGYGTDAFYARYFDPEFYHIILFDQRNARRSTPSATDARVLATNTPEQMVEDINRLAESFGVDFKKGEKIHLWGGSWGSALGLYYAAHYPERLHSLTIRAVTLGVADELNKMHELDVNGEPRLKAQVGPEQWKRCKDEWDKFFGFVKAHAPKELLDQSVSGAYHYLLTSPDVDKAVQLQAAHRFIMLEHVAGDQVQTPEQVEAEVNQMTPEQQLAYARIESNWEHHLNQGTPGFYAQKGNPYFNFFTDGVVKKGNESFKPMDQIARVPFVRVAHGVKDNVCFMKDTDLLERELKAAMQRRGLHGEALEQALKVRRPAESGHMISDPGITEAMVDFMDEIKVLQERKNRIHPPVDTSVARGA